LPLAALSIFNSSKMIAKMIEEKVIKTLSKIEIDVAGK
jgi:hypothetical protein